MTYGDIRIHTGAELAVMVGNCLLLAGCKHWFTTGGGGGGEGQRAVCPPAGGVRNRLQGVVICTPWSEVGIRRKPAFGSTIPPAWSPQA